MTSASARAILAVPATALLLLASACIPEEGPLMAAGDDCLECHGAGEGPGWNAAGTWEREGQTVRIVDDDGKSFTLRTNQVGNFYTAESLRYPLRVSVDGEAMESAVPSPLATGLDACVDHDGEQECCGATGGRGQRCGCNDCHDER